MFFWRWEFVSIVFVVPYIRQDGFVCFLYRGQFSEQQSREKPTGALGTFNPCTPSSSFLFAK